MTRREAAFVATLAEGGTVAEAAAAAKVSERSGYRWKSRPEIAAAVRAVISEHLATAGAVLAAGASRAARSLVDMSDGAAEAEAPKVSAARAVVETATKLGELREIEARLAEIEARLPTAPTGRFPTR